MTGLPLSGAAVWFGTRIGQTRPDGQYVLTGVPVGTGSLHARLIGYAPAAKTLTVVSGLTLDVDLVLTASAVNLSEIVVTGYGEQRSGNITGAVTQVSAADFNTGRIISPEELIRSKVPGVQVVDNNEPGGGFSIRIRGATSINASSEPLIVIDGVPIGTGAGGGLSAGRNPVDLTSRVAYRSRRRVCRNGSGRLVGGAGVRPGWPGHAVRSAGDFCPSPPGWNVCFDPLCPSTAPGRPKVALHRYRRAGTKAT